MRVGVFFSIALVCLALSTPPAIGGGSIMVGDPTSQPIGHYEFCKKNPTECAMIPGSQGPLVITGTSWRIIIRVNREVNDAIYPMSDYDIFGLDEVWSYPVRNPHIKDSLQLLGDCEDYALEKRRRLHAAGISLADLLITVVRQAGGQGHAVLTVRTVAGDFILDNLTDEVKLWDKTGYKYIKRQATHHAGVWVKIGASTVGQKETTAREK